jgi:SAM-dependent methyltransferase
MNKAKKILDVGCGNSKFKNSIGIDIMAFSDVDVVHDLNQTPWPFDENYFDRIIFKHSISHLNDIIKIMNEVHRIIRKDGIVDIIAPHFSCDNYFTDPTHKFSTGYRSMNYFCNNVENWNWKYTDKYYSLIKSYISFGAFNIDFNKNELNNRMNIHKYLGIEFLINKIPRIYEKFLSFIIPSSEVFFRLKCVK